MYTKSKDLKQGLLIFGGTFIGYFGGKLLLVLLGII